MISRLFRALQFTAAGLRHAAQHEAAVREELIGLAVLIPVSAFLPVSRVEHLLLVLPLLLLLAVELLNSAIERAIDRISLERHPLAGQAKDMGSAAVFVVLVMVVLCWSAIAGPLVLAWVRR